MDRLTCFTTHCFGYLIGILLVFSNVVYSMENRTALVIGNATYQGLPILTNPVNDADDMAVKLRKLGFEVIHKQNISYQAMEAAVYQFGRRLKMKGGVGLFFYAGHGIQVDGQNYLLPVDSRLKEKYEVKHQTLSADLVLDIMGNAGNPMNIVILDACRDNPFVRSSSRSLRLSRQGLAPMNAPSGSLIAYATGKGKVAADGSGRNGVYTGKLLKYMDQPNLSLEQVFKRVRAEVLKVTKGKQTPWEEGSLVGDFYFVSSSAIQPPNTELEFWKSVKNTDDSAYYRAYIARYGHQGLFTPIAKIKLAKLDQLTHSSQPASTRTIKIPSPIIIKSEPVQPLVINIKKKSVVSHSGFVPEMIEIRGGIFNMGSPDSEKGQFYNERLHVVQIDDFWIGKTEVTFAQYDVFAEKTGRNKPDDQGWGRVNRPVINISWYDAVAYTEWLSQETGQPYRLPTEAEWEYAARAGTKTPFSFGETINPEQINYSERFSYDWTQKGIFRKQTLEVQSFPANRWGLYEMHGNVWEWTCSSYDKAYGGDEQHCASSQTNTQRKYTPRVVRGGSWDDRGRFVRSAMRDGYVPGYRRSTLGLRVALDH